MDFSAAPGVLISLGLVAIVAALFLKYGKELVQILAQIIEGIRFPIRKPLAKPQVQTQEAQQHQRPSIKVTIPEWTPHFGIFQSIKLGFGFGIGLFLFGVIIFFLLGSVFVSMMRDMAQNQSRSNPNVQFLPGSANTNI